MKYHSSDNKTSEFHFGNFSIVTDEWDTIKVTLKHWSDWDFKNLTEFLSGN